MRVERWRANEVFGKIIETAIDSANDVMDEVVMLAKARCPVGTITRTGKFSSAKVSFIPMRGKNKGKTVSFSTDKRWAGRNPSDLRNSIRRVNKDNRPGNIRVIAGNFKIYWAHMVEYGTASTGWGKGTKAQPFLRPAFFQAQRAAKRRIEEGLSHGAFK